MSKFDHRLPLHVGDYLADTMHLSTLQHGIYIRWIMHYWKRRSLPDDEATLARIAGLSIPRLRRYGAEVRALFGVKNRTLTHNRLDAELARARAVSEARSNAGIQGASARWSDQAEMANATQVDDEGHSPARDPTSRYPKVPPRSPPASGGAARTAFRNGFTESTAADLQETAHHAQGSDPSADRPTVVPIPRHSHRH